MPTYNFKDTETNEEFEMMMKWSERELFLAENPHIEPIMTAPAIVSGVSITGKVPDGFKEVLSKVSENHKGSNLSEKHSKKSIKEVKTREIVNKVYNKQKNK
jgi:predicted nucleic acid-binding Zn ribbon protein